MNDRARVPRRPRRARPPISRTTAAMIAAALALLAAAAVAAHHRPVRAARRLRAGQRTPRRRSPIPTACAAGARQAASR